MVIYTLSSTDPQHFNRIQTKLPTELSSRFVNVCVTSLTVNVCVTSLTSNCNIEVMNADDHITFVFRPPDSPPTTRKVLMTPYSKLTSASLPYVLQDIFNAHTIPITVSLSKPRHPHLHLRHTIRHRRHVLQHEAHHRLLPSQGR